MFSLLFAMFGLAFVALLFAFWIWMIIDCAKNKGLSDTERIVWILVIIFTHWLGALIYFFAGRPKRLGT